MINLYSVKFHFNKLPLSCILLLLLCNCTNSNPGNEFNNWEVYGGSKSRIQYSSLNEVDTSNVQQLEQTWIYHTKDFTPGSQIQVNSMIIGNVLYGVSPQLKLFALDAATGVQQWVFDPAAAALPGTEGEKASINSCRGLTYYNDEKENSGRLFYTVGSSLYCINAADGKPVTSFGNGGTVDLHSGLGRDVAKLYITSTTPGIIYKDMIIMGSRVAEEAGAAPGDIRAYDVHSGKIRWTFHTIPYPGEPGYESWDDKEAYKHSGGVNAWAGFCIDEEKGIVFAPIGSATYDFYGGRRTGDNLYANSVLALDAATGNRIWHFQTIHHDVWDRDLPTAPVLVNVLKDGVKKEAVVQVTKTGFLFLFDRATGKPLYPINEVPVPSQSDLAGEKLSPTQPVPSFYETFCRQTFAEADLNMLVPDTSYNDILQRYKSFTTGQLFAPPSKKGTLVFPGTLGGAEWGGPAFDPESGLLYINSNEIANIITMVDVKDETKTTGKTVLQVGMALYNSSCMGCHGADRSGGNNYPSLGGVKTKYNEASFTALLNSGLRMMPAFKQLSEAEKSAIASFILDDKASQKKVYAGKEKAADYYATSPYSATGYNRFYTKEGYPANSPPWGTLTAVNLNTGKVVWKNTLGDYPEFSTKGIHTGTMNFGGPVVTAGGLLFIAATKDAKFRAFNKRTGKLLWEVDLPAAGLATPSVYHIDGKQFIVIACGGGGKGGAKSGDAYVAFALPDKTD